MLDLSNFIPIGSIGVICFVIGQLVKQLPFVNNKIVPIIVAVAGGILAVVGLKTGIPILADMNLFDAIATGIVSGFASSGVFSLYKNMTGAYDKED